MAITEVVVVWLAVVLDVVVFLVVVLLEVVCFVDAAVDVVGSFEKLNMCCVSLIFCCLPKLLTCILVRS